MNIQPFITDIFAIHDLINKGDESSSIIKVKTISKQYLAYYLYRIIVKYLRICEIGSSTSDITEFMTYLKIPTEHNSKLSYPIVGKMPIDNEILDLIIIRAIDILNKTDKYINKMPNKTAFEDLFIFFKQKKLQIILKDLIDLQKLIPGLSVSVIRPSYLNNSEL